MSTKHFCIHKHTLPACHIREYPRATADHQEDVLQLAIKQYTPKNSHGEGDITIIAAHANGFPKELYEPLWDDLFESLQLLNIRIRSIWIADVSHQGDSGVLNEHRMGDDPSWMDHPRDLLLMVNHFREHMKRPLIGIGHSMGGNNLINLSLMHPRLFTSLILMDPVVQRMQSIEGNVGPAKASTVRRDRWPSRREARAAFQKSKFYKTWDPRVLNAWVDHGLRPLPTLIYPDSTSGSKKALTGAAEPPSASANMNTTVEPEVTLKTTKHQEVFTFQRPNFPTPTYPDPSTHPNPASHPDVDPATSPNSPFYRPEPLATFSRLQHVRPGVFYIFGEESYLSHPVLKADKLAHTGIGVGGSGGVKKGRVAQLTMRRVGHLIPMEDVPGTANAIGGWVKAELELWADGEERERRDWTVRDRSQRSTMSEAFKRAMLGDWVDGGRGASEKTAQSKL